MALSCIDQAFSTVGTPDYIAPEVLLKKGYGMECDWLVNQTPLFYTLQLIYSVEILKTVLQ
jgi:serine/threonine protein kinase